MLQLSTKYTNRIIEIARFLEINSYHIYQKEKNFHNIKLIN